MHSRFFLRQSNEQALFASCLKSLETFIVMASFWHLTSLYLSMKSSQTVLQQSLFIKPQVTSRSTYPWWKLARFRSNK